MQFYKLYPPTLMKKQNGINFNSEKELSEYLLKVEMKDLRKELQEKMEEREKVYFNGYYSRNLLSPAGNIPSIAIPRFRGGNAAHELQVAVYLN